MKGLYLVVFLTILLSGCGGGGGTTPSTDDNTEQHITQKNPNTDDVNDGAAPTVTDDIQEDIVTQPEPNTAPRLILYGAKSVTITQYEPFVEVGFWAPDSEDGDLTAEVTVSSVDTSVLGDSSMIYSVKDSKGLQATAMRTIKIVPAPNTAPILTLNGENNLTITQHKPFIEEGFTASDKEDGDLTSQVTVSSIDTSILGSSSIVYSVEDSKGRRSTVSRAIMIVPNEAPTLKILGKSTDIYFIGQPYTEHGAEAVDKEDGNITATIDDSALDMNKTGTYKISYTCVDLDANAVKKYRTVVVKDELKISNEDIRDLEADEGGNLNTTFNLSEFIMPSESGEMIVKTYENGTLLSSFTQTTELIDENTSLLSFSHTDAKASYSLKADTIDIKILHNDDVVSSHAMNAYTRNLHDVDYSCGIKEYYNSISINGINYQDTIMLSCWKSSLWYSIDKNIYFTKGRGFLMSNENKTVR